MATYTLDWSDTNLGGSAVVSYLRGALLDFVDKPAGATAALSCAPNLGAGDHVIAEFSIETSGSSVMTFDYHVSSEANWDKLHVDVDGVSQANYSGVVAWTTHAGIDIASAGTHTIRFRFNKDAGRVNEDRIWIANLQITNTVTTNDDTGGTVDIYDLEDGAIPSFITTSTWTNSTSSPIAGSRSMRSPASTAANGSYDLVISKGVNAKYRVLAFEWKVSSETGWDKLLIFPDASGANVPPSGNPSGEGVPGWLDYSGTANGHAAIILPPTASSVLVRYTKDSGGDVGADAAWVDTIEMPVATAPTADGFILMENDDRILYENNDLMVGEEYVGGGGTAATGSASLTLSGSGTAGGQAPTSSGSLTLSASGTARVVGAGSGSLTLSATGTARAPAAGSASLTLAGSSTARAATTSSASLTLAATGTAVAQSGASGTASLTLSGSGAAQTVAAGSAAITLSGTGTYSVPVTGSAAIAVSGSGTAGHAVSGSGSLSLAASGTAVASQSSTATLTLTAAGTARAATQGSASLTLSGAGSGRAPSVGTGSLTLTASGTSQTTTQATASIVLTAVGTARGSASASTASIALLAEGEAFAQGSTSGDADIAFSASLNSNLVTGASAGTASLMLSGSGAPAARTTGSGSITLAASGASRAPTGSSAGITLSATGSAQARAVGSASLTLSGSATARSTAAGSASLSLSASASGSTPVTGTAALSLFAVADTRAQAVSAASLVVTAFGAARTPVTGAATFELTAEGEANSYLASVASLSLFATGDAQAALDAETAFIEFDADATAGIQFAGEAILEFNADMSPPSVAVTGTAAVTFVALGNTTGKVDITVFVGVTRKTSLIGDVALDPTRGSTLVVSPSRVGSLSVGATHGAGTDVAVGDNRRNLEIGTTRRDREE